MYEDIKDLSTFEQIEKMTLSLVHKLSVNGTAGEVDIANEIESILRSFPYFQKHPDAIWNQYLPNDSLGRKNVFARIKGSGNSKKTVIFHSHMDTVGVEDYGKLQPFANDHHELLKFFSKWEGNKEIQMQALSGDWMFGRGALDMKSGIAVHLANLLYFSEHRNEWEGEIIFMGNPVEENQHSGVIAAVEELLRLREDEHLDYVVAVNNDYISPLYPGDIKKYIYTGSGGKLLPCFYVYGRETHVGQTLGGLDPTLVTSELNKLINNNMELTEQVEGELVIPPSALYQRDKKDFYNVQTAVTSQLYFNLMVLEESPKDIMEKLRQTAIQATENVKKYYQKQYKAYSKINDIPSEMPSWDMEVYSYQEYCNKLYLQHIDVKSVTAGVVKENPNMEVRELCFEIIDVLRKLDREVKPCVILFYAPPYCPHNYLKGESARDLEILEAIQTAVKNRSEQSHEEFAVKRFFPYLSDSSYLSLHDTDEEIDYLINNFPEWKRIYAVPIDKIRKLNVPSINVGVYGLDAHRWTERVYKPYSFDTVPSLIKDMATTWLKVHSTKKEHNLKV